MGRPKVKVIERQMQTVEVDSRPQIQVARARRVATNFLPDKIANDSFYVRNYPIPKSKEIFPLEWRMQYAELCYPYAEGGPLFIDMPVTNYDVALCERKFEALKGRGIRYLFIKTDATETDCWELLEAIK